MTHNQFLRRMSIFEKSKNGKFILKYNLKLDKDEFNPNLIEYFVDINDIRLRIKIYPDMMHILLMAINTNTLKDPLPNFTGNDMQYLEKILENL